MKLKLLLFQWIGRKLDLRRQTISLRETSAMNVLVIDDELNIRKTLSLFFESEGQTVFAVSNPDDALTEAGRRSFDLVLLDLRLGTSSGLDLIPKLLATSPWLKIVIITAYASIDTAVEAIKRGATDYLPKPFTPAQLQLVLSKVTQVRSLEQKLNSLQETLRQADAEIRMDSESPAMQRAVRLAQDVAGSEATVLLVGESGTGKSLLAKLIHQWSPRRAKPFGVVSCPSLSADLLESELFGHVKGAFTGAVQDQLGRIATCDGGTLLLDEIGDLPLPLQPKLLRFLQDREYERLGEGTTRKADLRVMAATSIDLQTAVKQGRFREELLYRLNVFEIPLPPLRERAADIPALAEQFLAFFARQNHRRLLGITEDAMRLLCTYPWPGNVREFRNAIERAVILCKSDYLDVNHLPEGLSRAQPSVALGDPVPIEKIEELHIRRVLASTKSLEEASEILGIDSATLWRRRKQYGI
jgi:NtrC-family two-component system response regulator AlgB